MLQTHSFVWFGQNIVDPSIDVRWFRKRAVCSVVVIVVLNTQCAFSLFEKKLQENHNDKPEKLGIFFLLFTEIYRPRKCACLVTWKKYSTTVREKNTSCEYPVFGRKTGFILVFKHLYRSNYAYQKKLIFLIERTCTRVTNVCIVINFEYTVVCFYDVYLVLLLSY